MRKIFLGLLVVSRVALGATFVIEGDTLSPVPKDVVTSVLGTLQNSLLDRDGNPCEFVGKSVNLKFSASSTPDWIVTTSDACSWGAYAAPIWVIYRSDAGYRVVLSDSAYDVTLGPTGNNGLRNIATASASAGVQEEKLWKYDGTQYKLVCRDVQ
ncbi:MAG: hypothetical protein LBE62_04905 [Azonexus sp.]|jgi:hypothetical protein|nr:hypothetical protein [Azonexus sp.]